MAELVPGAAFGGFRIEGVAGRGGMGIVYRARDLRLGRAVALKVIEPRLAADPGFRERFEREAMTAAQLDDEHVIPVLHAGEEDGQLFLAMRYVDGLDLKALVTRDGPLEAARAAALVEQVARALDAAHAAGVVHRDVKPANILVEPRRGREHAFLTDFGVTKQLVADSELTDVGQWLGTAAYAAPEQVRAEPVDRRADVYALGGVLFFALVGRAPFAPRPAATEKDAGGPAPPARSAPGANVDPPQPSADRPELVPLDAVVARAMAKDRDERYPTAGELGAAAIAAAEAVTAAPDAAAAPDGPAGLGEDAYTRAHTADPPPARPRPRPRPRQRAPRPPVRLVAAAVASLAVAGGAVAVLTGGGAPPAPLRDGAVVDERGGTVRELAVDDAADGVAAAAGALWVLDRAGDQVTRAAPDGGGTSPVGAPTGASSIAGGGGTVWVGNRDAVTQIHPPPTGSYSTADFPLGFEPTDLAVDGDAVWALDGAGRSVHRLAGNGTRQAVSVPGNPVAVTAGEGAAWALSADGTLTEVRVSGGALTAASGPATGLGGGTDVVWGDGGLWVLDGTAGVVVRVDPASGAASRLDAHFGGDARALAAMDGVVWVGKGDGRLQPLTP